MSSASQTSSAESFEVALSRLVARLRVVGPRWQKRTDAAAVQGAAAAFGLLQRCADVAAEAQSEPVRAVPDHGAAVLADQFAVIGADVQQNANPQDQADLAAKLKELRLQI